MLTKVILIFVPVPYFTEAAVIKGGSFEILILLQKYFQVKFLMELPTSHVPWARERYEGTSTTTVSQRPVGLHTAADLRGLISSTCKISFRRSVEGVSVNVNILGFVGA